MYGVFHLRNVLKFIIHRFNKATITRIVEKDYYQHNFYL
ncbi:hypothetical protein HMPREF9944_01581 [Segatella maculosa OT 289]|uniref:Uncharacterized protein n=1 Tax=Segatella maculosa OT 289 TaxID=999422 RepID=H1HN37_9BACT|nr:hypothetical protein HMPREF9944_01581 [Segatella maculosa OT 289]